MVIWDKNRGLQGKVMNGIRSFFVEAICCRFLQKRTCALWQHVPTLVVYTFGFH